MAHLKKKKKESKRNITKKYQMTDLLGKNFKTTVLKMLKEQKKDREKVKKDYKKNGNTNKEIENLKTN